MINRFPNSTHDDPGGSTQKISVDSVFPVGRKTKSLRHRYTSDFYSEVGRNTSLTWGSLPLTWPSCLLKRLNFLRFCLITPIHLKPLLTQIPNAMHPNISSYSPLQVNIVSLSRCRATSASQETNVETESPPHSISLIHSKSHQPAMALSSEKPSDPIIKLLLLLDAPQTDHPEGRKCCWPDFVLVILAEIFPLSCPYCDIDPSLSTTSSHANHWPILIYLHSVSHKPLRWKRTVPSTSIFCTYSLLSRNVSHILIVRLFALFALASIIARPISRCHKMILKIERKCYCVEILLRYKPEFT